MQQIINNLIKELKEITEMQQRRPQYRRGVDTHVTNIPIKEIDTKDLILTTGTGHREPIKAGHPMLTPRGTGSIFNFNYRNWHHDPRPQILVFYKGYGKTGPYYEGLNLRYLPSGYVRRLFRFVCFFPRVTSYSLYEIIKKSYPVAIAKGYRRYLTKFMRPGVSVYK